MLLKNLLISSPNSIVCIASLNDWVSLVQQKISIDHRPACKYRIIWLAINTLLENPLLVFHHYFILSWPQHTQLGRWSKKSFVVQGSLSHLMRQYKRSNLVLKWANFLVTPFHFIINFLGQMKSNNFHFFGKCQKKTIMLGTVYSPHSPISTRNTPYGYVPYLHGEHRG